jgi:aquaporin NIP
MKKYISEFFGTFILVFCGTGAITINEVTSGTVGHAGIAVTFGLVVMAMIYALGDVSGAHLNPAVSLAFWLQKKLETGEFIKYVMSQTAGSFMASAILKFLFPQSAYLGTTLPAGGEMQSFLLEIILTFILLFVIMQLATGSKEKGVIAGIAIGSVILLEAMFAGPITGASMNPARSLAPAIISGNLQSLWIYLTAPFIGAALGGSLSVYLKRQPS